MQKLIPVLFGLVAESVEVVGASIGLSMTIVAL